MEGQLPSAFFTGNLLVGYSAFTNWDVAKIPSEMEYIHFYLGVSQPRRIVTAVLRLRNTLTYLLT